MKFVRLLGWLVFLVPVLSEAEIRLPGFYGESMVMQRQAPIPIWGWADPGEEVTVQLGAAEAVTGRANETGRWEVTLPAMEAIADGLELKFSSSTSSFALSDVLVGEVWLCSGQSNMEWTVSASDNPEAEIAAADFPQIRQMKIAHLTNNLPLDDVKGDWLVCSPETAGSFTAAGYFMARELHRELGVPIGLLNISWGGTLIEPWTPIEGFAMTPGLADIYAKVQTALPGSQAYKDGLRKYLEAITAWQVLAETALAEGTSAPASPVFPKRLLPITAHTEPTTIFNAMMNPVVGYGMRGAIWYQGESNHARGMDYLDRKKALLAGWRSMWGIGDFPFYFVQIAPFVYGEEDPAILPRFWEAQSACLEIPHTGMVVTNDIGNPADIHPKNKQEVGRRLSLLALKHTYGKSDLVASGPKLAEMTVAGATLRLRFDEVAGGLKSRDGQPLSHFEMIGEQGAFVPANAVIEGTDTVVLASPEIKEPAAMRYAWHKLAEPNLANGAGLPTATFRAGEVPQYDWLSLKVPGAAAYDLVYDLDLKKLGPNFSYEVDRSSEIAGAFDRVGYFIELTPGGGSLQWAWVAMDAFTDDAGKLGIPTVSSGATFQVPVTNLSILSNVSGVSTGHGLFGNLEFWPHNYGPVNAAKLPGGSGELWDFADQPIPPEAGYGSMQVHNSAAKETIFAVNQWNAGGAADLGIGNSSSDPRTRDWTFSSNAGKYESGRLRILVRKTK